MSIETRFNISPEKEAQCALWIAYSATASTGFTTTSSRGLNEISHIHRHLLHCSIVESLNVSQDPLVLFSDKIDSHTFSAKTATPTNSAQKENTFTPKLTSPICFTSLQDPFINCCSYLPLATLCCLNRASCHPSHIWSGKTSSWCQQHSRSIPRHAAGHTRLLLGCKVRSSFNAWCCVLKSWVSLSPLCSTTHPPLMHPTPGTEHMFNSQTKLIQLHTVTE